MKKGSFDKYLAEQIKEDPSLQSELDILSKAINVSSQIYELREKRGYTQAELAQKAGTKQSNIARLEDSDYTGYSLKTLNRIANALGVELKISFEAEELRQKSNIHYYVASLYSVSIVSQQVSLETGNPNIQVTASALIATSKKELNDPEWRYQYE